MLTFLNVDLQDNHVKAVRLNPTIQKLRIIFIPTGTAMAPHHVRQVWGPPAAQRARFVMRPPVKPGETNLYRENIPMTNLQRIRQLPGSLPMENVFRQVIFNSLTVRR